MATAFVYIILTQQWFTIDTPAKMSAVYIGGIYACIP